MGLLLIDASNLVFSTVIEYHRRTKDQIDMSLVRNLVLDRLISVKNRLKTYEEIVLCFDGKSYWRKKFFPFYKAKRAAARDADSFDWDAFFKFYDQLKTEIRESVPVKCLEVVGAEADDLIATLCKVYGPHTDICIVSSDKDFIQVQQFICPRVKQWSLFHAKFLTPKNAEYDLMEHIIKGDTGDGIPNILSDGDTLVSEDKRQKPVKKAFLDECKRAGIGYPEKFCKTFEQLENFNRNMKLIDLRQIPEELTSVIVQAYNNAACPKGKFFNYCVANKLTRFLSNGGF